MWQILRAEFNYHKNILFGITFIVVYVKIIEAIDRLNSAYFILFMILYLFPQNWYNFRSREKRDYFFQINPLPALQIGVVRIAMIFPYCATVIFLSALIQAILPLPQPFNPLPLILVSACLILGFSIVYELNELSGDFFRKIGITRNRLRMACMVIFLGLNLLGLLVMVQTYQAGRPTAWLESLIEFVNNSHPLITTYGKVTFLIVISAVAAFPVWTFGKRRFYV
ncbi:MAG: hypothetical protein ACE5HS_14350 [bacterium]